MADGDSLEVMAHELGDVLASKVTQGGSWSMYDLSREFKENAERRVKGMNPLDLMAANPSLLDAQPFPTRPGETLGQVIAECAVRRMEIVIGPTKRSILLEHLRESMDETATMAFSEGLDVLRLLIDNAAIDTDITPYSDALENWQTHSISSSDLLDRLGGLNEKIERGLAYARRVFGSSLDQVFDRAQAYFDVTRPFADAVLIARQEVVELLTGERSPTLRTGPGRSDRSLR
ncbi:hypothetical protein HFN89_05640 [Rhizobium laguerreae]|nr:hypothetical protein [Rhizobium laguerreae]